MENELINAVLAMDDATVRPAPDTFVVVIDSQYDFMMPDGLLYVKGAEQTIVPIIEFLGSLNPDEIAGVLFTADTHYADTYPQSEEAKQFPIHCVRGTKGWANVFNPGVVNPLIETVTLEKGVFNMWEEAYVAIRDIYGRPLAIDGDRESYFDELAERGVRRVIIVGVAADFCVKWAADGFMNKGFHVEIPRKLTAGILRDIDTVVNEDYDGCNIRVSD